MGLTDKNQLIRSTLCTNGFDDLTRLFAEPITGISAYTPDRSRVLLAGETGDWRYEPATQTVHRLSVTQPTGTSNYSVSPTGTYAAFTAFQFASAVITATTSVVNLNTDQRAERIQWRVQPNGDGLLDPGLIWLGDEQFLIQTTMDQGPLLVKMGKSTMPIGPTLFGVLARPRQWAVAALVDGSQHYHIAFSTPASDDVSLLHYDPMRLYDSVSGKITELPFQHTLGFSPDGKWLLGYSEDSSNLWLWPVDNNKDQGVRLPLHGPSNIVWKPDSSQLISGGYGGITLFVVPSGAQVGFLKFNDYNAEPFGWSPDGKFLAVRGIGYGQEALFIVQTDLKQ